MSDLIILIRKEIKKNKFKKIYYLKDKLLTFFKILYNVHYFPFIKLSNHFILNFLLLILLEFFIFSQFHHIEFY